MREEERGVSGEGSGQRCIRRRRKEKEEEEGKERKRVRREING